MSGVARTIVAMIGTVVLTQLAVGCVTHGPMTDGPEVRAPQGWVQFCRDNPDDEGCRDD